MIRKFVAEFVGTFLLVFFGCGVAVSCSQYMTTIGGGGVILPYYELVIALAFGLVLTALVYTIGKVSGAHVNPTVSVACTINGRISVFECVYYVCAQVLGSIVGAALLSWIFQATTSLGANGYDISSALPKLTTLPVALVIESILTFIFVLVVLSTTKKENCSAGLVIGLTLALVHIMGLPFTGTSVNPARSIGPALLTGGETLDQLWVFIVAPLIGGIVAALFYKFVIDFEEPSKVKETTKDEDDDEDDDEEDEDDDEEVEVKVKKTPTKKTTKKTTTKKGN